MLRLALFFVLSVIVARAFWRMVDGVIEGLTGRPAGPPPSTSMNRGLQMARDPVCGTFVVPDSAVALVDGRRRLFFCSAVCRDKYLAQAG